MQMKLKVTVAAAIAAAAGVALAQDMVVKIGHVAPISGAQASYGKDNENGARMAIEDLNAAGVMIGGKKVKLELVAEDDAADPKQGAAVAQKLCDACAKNNFPMRSRSTCTCRVSLATRSIAYWKA